MNNIKDDLYIQEYNGKIDELKKLESSINAFTPEKKIRDQIRKIKKKYHPVHNK